MNKIDFYVMNKVFPISIESNLDKPLINYKISISNRLYFQRIDNLNKPDQESFDEFVAKYGKSVIEHQNKLYTKKFVNGRQVLLKFIQLNFSDFIKSIKRRIKKDDSKNN